MSRPPNGYVPDDEREPAAFFRTLGLVPVADDEFPARLEEMGGTRWLEGWERALDAAGEDPLAPVRFLHEDLERALLGFGLDFDRLCRAAWLLGRLETPGAGRVLDLGGGGGQLAFWMRRLWPASAITVADPLPAELGRRWAERTGIASVEFVEASLPHLEGLREGSCDRVVVSSVLETFLRAAGGPGFPLEGPRERRDDATVARLLEAWRGIGRVLVPGGSLVLVEEISSRRLATLEVSLERSGLAVDWECSALDAGGGGVSLLVATAAKSEP